MQPSAYREHSSDRGKNARYPASLLETTVIYITHRRMSGGTEHEHIVSVKYYNTITGVSGSVPRQTVVDWLNRGETVKVKDPRTGVDVPVHIYDKIYIRTIANNRWADNLLALPEY